MREAAFRAASLLLGEYEPMSGLRRWNFMTPRERSKPVVYAALAANLLVALTKFVAAFWTGSSAMLSEAVHSVVDTGNQGVLLYGIHRSLQPPDDMHPLGHGRELYFWSFIVALLMFTIGAGVTFFEGLSHIYAPHPIENPVVNYIVLACSTVFEGATWLYAWSQFRKTCGERGFYHAVRESKDPPAFMVLFEDSAALIGLAIAFVGTFAASYFDMPVIDGIASIGISIVLAAVALLLARESKGLLIGEPAARYIRESIIAITRSVPGIERAKLLFTVHLAPHQIVAALSLEFRDSLTTPEIEEKIAHLERAIHDRHPDVIAVFVKPQALDGNYGAARLVPEKSPSSDVAAS
jgi:cation diffusion facilitator family transporter